MKRFVKRLASAFLALAIVATAAGGTVKASAATQNSEVFAKFCKNDSTAISMVQLAVNGASTVVYNADDEVYNITIPITEFTYSRTVGNTEFTGTGRLTGLTVVAGETTVGTYTASYNGTTGQITIQVPEDYYVIDGAKHLDVNVSYTIVSGNAPANMSSAADLYFSQTREYYTE